MAIATAAKQIIVDNMDVTIGGGVESISLVQTPQMRVAPDPELLAMHKDIYMPMLQTAEVVAKRYGISRDAQDEYAPPVAAAHRRRAGRRQVRRRDRAGHRDDERRQQGDQGSHHKEVTLTKDEGNRADTTLEGLQSLKPCCPSGTITAGNAASSRTARRPAC